MTEVEGKSSREVKVLEKDKSLKQTLQFLLKELETGQDVGNIAPLLNEATLGITVKCISRVAHLLTKLETVEETLFNLEVSPHTAASEQDAFSKQVISILEVTRKYISLIKDMGITTDKTPRRRRLIELLEGLTEDEIEKLVEIIEVQLKVEDGKV